MDVKRVRENMKELEKASGVERVLEVLHDFEDNLKPTEALLRETKVGVAVNKLRSHSDSRVSGIVKKLVASWREQVQQQKHKKVAQSRPSAPQQNYHPPPKNGKRDHKADGINIQIYDDTTRNSCIGVVYNALVLDNGAPPKAVLDAAKDVEGAVYAREKGTTPGYRQKMRSLYMNLKDPKNPGLRTSVIFGEISGERLRSMTPQEMAPSELKKEIEAIAKQNLFNARGAVEQHSVTDRFTCGKCKQKRVSYYQMQTRSADEPLTTFCTCENCGNRWKFS